MKDLWKMRWNLGSSAATVAFAGYLLVKEPLLFGPDVNPAAVGWLFLALLFVWWNLPVSTACACSDWALLQLCDGLFPTEVLFALTVLVRHPLAGTALVLLWLMDMELFWHHCGQCLAAAEQNCSDFEALEEEDCCTEVQQRFAVLLATLLLLAPGALGLWKGVTCLPAETAAGLVRRPEETEEEPHQSMEWIEVYTI